MILRPCILLYLIETTHMGALDLARPTRRGEVAVNAESVWLMRQKGDLFQIICGTRQYYHPKVVCVWPQAPACSLKNANHATMIYVGARRSHRMQPSSLRASGVKCKSVWNIWWFYVAMSARHQVGNIWKGTFVMFPKPYHERCVLTFRISTGALNKTPTARRYYRQ